MLVCRLIVGEIFPLSVRGQATAVATLVNFGSNFGVRCSCYLAAELSCTDTVVWYLVTNLRGCISIWTCLCWSLKQGCGYVTGSGTDALLRCRR